MSYSLQSTGRELWFTHADRGAPDRRVRAWLATLRDRRAAARINARIDRAAQGNFGDAKFFGGVGEMRVDYGPGYRVYFLKRGEVFVVLLCGGDKSTQGADVERAKRIAEDLKHG